MEVTINGQRHATSIPLATLLHKLQIPIIYKQEVRRLQKKLVWQTRAAVLRQMSKPILIALVLAVALIGVPPIFFIPGGTMVYLGRLFGGIIILLVIFLIKDTLGGVRWVRQRCFSIESLDDLDVPQRVLRTMDRIREELNVSCYVESLDDDPFALVTCGDEECYIAHWNEPCMYN